MNQAFEVVETTAASQGSDIGDKISEVLIAGNLANLTGEERTKYYMSVCNSLKLNPLTKPFEYIVLNNKLTLYATKSCTEQLRKNNRVSVVDMSQKEVGGCLVVSVKVQDGFGRCDMSTGAVNIMGLKGEGLANAIMKCETKAKRRATLSICGLAVLDESELDTIPADLKHEFKENKAEEQTANTSNKNDGFRATLQKKGISPSCFSDFCRFAQIKTKEDVKAYEDDEASLDTKISDYLGGKDEK